MFDDEDTFINLKEMKAKTGSKATSTYYRWMEQGLFPKPERIGPNSVAWRLSVIKEWAANPLAWSENH